MKILRFEYIIDNKLLFKARDFRDYFRYVFNNQLMHNVLGQYIFIPEIYDIGSYILIDNTFFFVEK